jgi:hypothetical protein
MSDEEHRLASLTLGLGGMIIIGGCLTIDRFGLTVTGFALIVCGSALVWAALSEAGRDE